MALSWTVFISDLTKTTESAHLCHKSRHSLYSILFQSQIYIIKKLTICSIRSPLQAYLERKENMAERPCPSFLLIEL